MNNIYVIYIVLCESIIPILLLFKFLFLFKSATPWTRNVPGRQRLNASMPLVTRYARPNIRRDKNLGKGFEHHPTYGRTNIQYVQPMDDEIHTYFNLPKLLVHNMDEEITPKQSNMWTRKR